MGNKVGNKYDFDVIVEIPNLDRREYLLNINVFYKDSKKIIDYFYQNVIDEFGNPVKIDLFFTQDASDVESYREIK